jgi:sugar phosphate isomerase/epimerase
MKRGLSLASLMALHYTPPQMIQLAADTGCDAVAVRLAPTAPGGIAWRLMDDPALLRETLATMAGTGVGVLDLELVRINAGFDLADWQPFAEVGAKLAAKHVLVIGDDADEARLIDHYGALCDLLAPYGLTADIEFMPWVPCRDLASAKRVLAAAARPNGGVLVDALHFARSGSRLDQLDDIPREWLHYAQICDGAVPGPTTNEGQIHDARCERLLPGEGGIDLRALFGRLPPDITVGIEIPSDSRAPVIGYAEWARRAVSATLEVLGKG